MSTVQERTKIILDEKSKPIEPNEKPKNERSETLVSAFENTLVNTPLHLDILELMNGSISFEEFVKRDLEEKNKGKSQEEIDENIKQSEEVISSFIGDSNKIISIYNVKVDVQE